MSSRPFVLGVDLDGVCADFYAALRPIAAEWLGVEEASLTEQVSYNVPEWELETVGGYEQLHRFAVTQRRLFRDMKPIYGAPASLRRLSCRENPDIRIRIITFRLFVKHFHREAVAQTIEWLDHHGIPYADLCFMKDKAAVGADLYIEDAPDNVKRLRADGHRTIVFRNSTNLDLPAPRADSWEEVEELVAKELERWKKREARRHKSLAGE